jgi:hypothetical protein
VTYLFRCVRADCNETAETSEYGIVPTCWGWAGEEPHGKMRRDYRAENIGVDRFALRVWGNRWTRRDPEATA